MDEPIELKKCDNHKEVNIAFYCFDDNSFLCSKCFKEHKKHDIEIIDDLKEKDKISISLKTKFHGLLHKNKTNFRKTTTKYSKSSPIYFNKTR